MRNTRIGMLLLSSMVLAIAPAFARVQDYQVLRLLSYDSTCLVDTLSPAQKIDSGALRYHASCSNLNAYPQGIDIECADADDERSCRVLTRSQTFDQLHLLDQR